MHPFGLQAFAQSISCTVEEDSEVIARYLENVTDLLRLEPFDLPQNKREALALRHALKAVGDEALDFSARKVLAGSVWRACPTSIDVEASLNHVVDIVSAVVPPEIASSLCDLVHQDPVDPGRDSGPAVEVLAPAQEHQHALLHGIFRSICGKPTGASGSEQPGKDLANDGLQDLDIAASDRRGSLGALPHAVPIVTSPV